MVIFLEMAGAVMTDLKAVIPLCCQSTADGRLQNSRSDSEQVTADAVPGDMATAKQQNIVCTTAVTKPQINGVRENEVKNSALINPCNHLNYLPLLRIVNT